MNCRTLTLAFYWKRWALHFATVADIIIIANVVNIELAVMIYILHVLTVANSEDLRPPLRQQLT